MEPKRELLVKGFRSNAEAPIGLWQHCFFEPLLVFVDGVAGRLYRCPKTVLFVRGERTQPRLDHVSQDRENAAVLLDGGLGVNLGDTGGLEFLADLPQQARKLLQPHRGAVEPLAQWREFPRQEPVDGAAGEPYIDERIPRPLAQFFELPQVGAELVFEQCRVDLIGAGKRIAGDLTQLIQLPAVERSLPAACLGPHLSQLAVEAVVAQPRRGYR